MSLTEIKFIFEYYSSYEDFQKKIAYHSADIEKLLSHLSNVNNRAGITVSAAEEIAGISHHSYLLSNLLQLYRWLVSDGYRYFDEDDIDTVFEFLNKVRIPDSVAKRIKWGVVFIRREGFDNDEETWKETILKHFSSLEKNSFTISDIVTSWMVCHIGLKQLFAGQKSELSNTMEIVLSKYLGLVDNHSELEEIFGVAIEKDMFRIHELYEEKESG